MKRIDMQEVRRAQKQSSPQSLSGPVLRPKIHTRGHLQGKRMLESSCSTSAVQHRIRSRLLPNRDSHEREVLLPEGSDRVIADSIPKFSFPLRGHVLATVERGFLPACSSMPRWTRGNYPIHLPNIYALTRATAALRWVDELRRGIALQAATIQYLRVSPSETAITHLPKCIRSSDSNRIFVYPNSGAQQFGKELLAVCM